MARKVLTQKETFALLKFMEEGFKEAKLDDARYAEMAGKALGIGDLNRIHIATARGTLGLDNYLRPAQPHGETRIKELEEMVLAMAVKMDDIVRKVEMLQRDFHLHPPVPPLAGRGK